MSSSETAFELGMLMKFDAELLLGQISYNQKADIYNYCNRYPVHPKKCSTLEKEELPRFVWMQCYPLTHTHSGSFLLSYSVLVSGVNIMYQRGNWKSREREAGNRKRETGTGNGNGITRIVLGGVRSSLPG